MQVTQSGIWVWSYSGSLKEHFNSFTELGILFCKGFQFQRGGYQDEFTNCFQGIRGQFQRQVILHHFYTTKLVRVNVFLWMFASRISPKPITVSSGQTESNFHICIATLARQLFKLANPNLLINLWLLQHFTYFYFFFCPLGTGNPLT